MASLVLANIYHIGESEKVKEMEVELAHDLYELKTELEEVDLPPKTTSSVPIPEKKEHFRRERQAVVERLLEVSEAQPVRIQANEMKLEMEISELNEYTTGSIPLLLHQFFNERIQHLIHLKHQQMLRWTRFCQCTRIMESLYPIYNQRLIQLLDEYRDCVQRAQRLAVVREALILGHPESGVTAVSLEDLLIYLRWLVCQLHSMKRFNQFLKVLQWLPISHKKAFVPPDVNAGETEEAIHVLKMTSHYQEDLLTHSLPRRSKPASPTPLPPPLTPTLLSTTPLPSSAMLYAAAASGGGLACDENMLAMPVHSTDLESFRHQLAFLMNIYAINFDLSSVHNSADEMELFSAVNRRFKHVFVKQEHMSHFKTYDRIEAGQTEESSSHMLWKEANWCEFTTLSPEKDHQQEKMWAELQRKRYMDELLKVKANFLQVSNNEKVQNTLKEHAVQVRTPLLISSASVNSHRISNNMSIIWKKIYSNPDLFSGSQKGDDISVPDIDEKDVENVQTTGHNSDYVSHGPILGLGDDEQDKSDPVTAQGAYLSYLYLRHLRIRDMQRTCLSVLNYFRSIERTLTINDMGLLTDEDNLKQGSCQNHRTGTELDGSLGGAGGLGSHAYLHNTPADFKMSESDFIQFSAVENHDDFYSIEEGRIHVLDQRGYNILYDKALEDLRNLEAELILVSSHYLEKDRELRSRAQLQGTGTTRTVSAGYFDIPTYAHQDVDRFGILLDVWNNESAFLECKRELLDCYYEAYQHVVDRDERRRLAQVITNIIHQRPRFDLEDEYFVRMYRAECCVLQQHAALVKVVLDRQMKNEREFIQRVNREDKTEFGLPHRIIPKQPIAVNLSRPALKSVYMLEFHPSLAIASRIPPALKHAYWDLCETCEPGSVYAAVMMEKKLFKLALEEWEMLPLIGTGFSMQVQRDLFSDVFAEDPLFQCQLAMHMVQEEEEEGGRKPHKAKQTAMVKTVARLMNILTLRHRLIDACWETEILSKVYKQQAAEMGFPDFHLNMRFVQFEFASFKEKVGKAPPIFITAVQEDDATVDKYSPSCLYLAIHELDESHVGRFTFRSQDGVLQMMKFGGLESFQIVLKSQIVHKNALVSAVIQASVCNEVKVREWKSAQGSPTETKSEKSSLTQMTGMSSDTSGTVRAGKLTSDDNKSRQIPEAFFSLQLEKTPSRDLMLNEYVMKKQQMESLLQNVEDVERIKRKLISQFCERFHLRLSHASLRAQLVAYYNSMLRLLANFPIIRDTYFVLGEPNEKQSTCDDITADGRVMKKCPRQLLSSDGRHVLNIWFIAHPTEVLTLYRTLDDEACVQALSFSLAIVSALHDILQYLSAHARLGSKKMELVSANWGGREGIGSKLREIQKQIQHLHDPSYPQAVIELLNLARDVMFLEYDTAIRSCMADTFLSSGNIQAYQSIVTNAHYALTSISNVQRPSLMSTYLTLPEPLEGRDLSAKQLFPWRAFIHNYGPYPTAFWQWFRIEQFLHLCLAGLKDVDRQVAHGEILAVKLLMEDVLQTGYSETLLYSEAVSKTQSQSESRAEAGSRRASVTSDLGKASQVLGHVSQVQAAIQPNESLSRVQQPLKSYRLLRFFLLLCKCLERLKLDWGKRKLRVQAINSSVLFQEFCKAYRREILQPVLQSVARALGQGDFYDSLILDTDVYVMPTGASEIEVKLKQLVRLLERQECHMISQVRQRVSRELNLALAERAREEEALPTDLWKRGVMKENFTLNRSHISEKFIKELMSQAQETDAVVTFNSKHLQFCLAELSRNEMARERHVFDSYCMYYEHLLRIQHQLLYQREQEIQHLKLELQQVHTDSRLMVHYQMAHEAHDLLMEITALRGKIAEMRELTLTQERDIRERVREEYEEFIQNIFNSTFQLRRKFDAFRNDVQNDVLDKISESRKEAIDVMSKLQQKFKGTSDEEETQINLDRAEQLRALQNENHHLKQLLLKMKAMCTWRENVRTQNFLKTTSELQKKAEQSKKEHLRVKMLAEQEIILLHQQLVAIRKALTATEKDCNEVRKVLQRELRLKSERQHESAQKTRSKNQLKEAKQTSIDRLLDELTEKESRLKQLEDEQERSRKLSQQAVEKSRRDVHNITKQLQQERMLKLNAFNRVDTLQCQVYDFESCLLNQPSASMTNLSKPRSQTTSALVSKGSLPPTESSQWPAAVTWPANRSLTPFGELPLDGTVPFSNQTKKLQRPKTVGGRLRHCIAKELEQLPSDGAKKS